MYVREYMQTRVITIPSDTLVVDAQKLMDQNNIRRLPVVDKGKLVGIVTKRHLQEVTPSSLTSLSVWEMHYLLAKIKVSEVMERRVITVSPDVTLEEAARVGAEHRLGALPVVENGHLVGIITETDMFRIFLQVLGPRESGVRLHLRETPTASSQADVLMVIAQHGAQRSTACFA